MACRGLTSSPALSIPPLLCALALLACAPACGRSGFDLLAARDADPLDESDAGIPEDGGLPADCTSTMMVTTAADEDDPEETAEPPHQGAGLSLREAIRLGNGAPGQDCVAFDGLTDVAYGTELPPLTDPDGLVIDGAGAVTLSGGAPVGLRLAAPYNLIRGLRMTGFAVGVLIERGPNTLRRVQLFESSGIGILVGTGVAGVEIGPCLLYDNQLDAIRATGSIDLRVRHCTITTNGGRGIDATAGATGLTVLNTIVFDNGDDGVAVDEQAAVSIIDHVDLFGNRLQQCLNCVPGASSIAADPLFTDPLIGDYTLQPGSPAIDVGIDTGLDVNGLDPGLYNGAAPDLGYHESPPPL